MYFQYHFMIYILVYRKKNKHALQYTGILYTIYVKPIFVRCKTEEGNILVYEKTQTKESDLEQK